jgi:hypothetical protein
MNEVGISPKNRRQHERLSYRGPVLVSWDDDQGLVRYSHAKLLDISQDGLRIEMAEPISIRSRLSLRADRINFSGSAIVRSLTWRRCKYTMGLSLSQAQSSSALAIIRVSPASAPLAD